ncbi:hypothetical protein K469DRAFT_778181 [Zopfia rhizophila CBS 207.26]|uniref:Uncharacterized protein n=1 Tax=Zopfia rhizophila CBS 207.26 TaxID=1314779 RepID=A0A6A6E2K4_9PEZI|nr:hypothetical protein K469DRAFT_778181 [Zopfia rhizophila CBS 207.26]
MFQTIGQADGKGTLERGLSMISRQCSAKEVSSSMQERRCLCIGNCSRQIPHGSSYLCRYPLHFGPPAGILLPAETTKDFNFVGMPPGAILLIPLSIRVCEEASIYGRFRLYGL